MAVAERAARALTMAVIGSKATDHPVAAPLHSARALGKDFKNTAMVAGVPALSKVVCVPFLQRAFDTVALKGSDWLLCVGSSVLWLREASKLVKP